MSSRIMRLGLAAAAVAAAIVIGIELLPGSNTGAQLTSGPTPSPVSSTTMGKLAYGRNGDIYVADWDGSNPVRIANGDSPRPGQRQLRGRGVHLVAGRALPRLPGRDRQGRLVSRDGQHQ